MLYSEIKDDEMYRVVFDLKLKRPGCALLQASFGCDGMIAGLFNTDSWLLAPTEDMHPYKIPGNELKKAVTVINSKKY